MKRYIAKIDWLEAVPSEGNSNINVGYNTVKTSYEIVSEADPLDDELRRVTFIMWISEFTPTQIDRILESMNSKDGCDDNMSPHDVLLIIDTQPTSLTAALLANLDITVDYNMSMLRDMVNLMPGQEKQIGMVDVKRLK